MEDYSDIINLKRPISKHPKMPIESRASIFNPFQAMTGYDDCIKEENRYVESKRELGEDLIENLNSMINYILENPNEEYLITYFVKDKTKNGGVYYDTYGIVDKLSINDRFIIINDIKISFDNLYKIVLSKNI